ELPSCGTLTQRERQRPSAISHREVQEVDRVVNHRPVHQRANLSTPATRETFENLPGDRPRARRVEPVSRTGAAARIARRATRFESACKAQPRRLSATRRSGCRRFRSRAAPGFPSATYESTGQGFSRASRVGKLLSADTSHSPRRLFPTTSGDFDGSASSFQKTTPSQGKTIQNTRKRNQLNRMRG